MGELADYIHGKIGTRAMMMPPADAVLHKILVKLFDAATLRHIAHHAHALRWVILGHHAGHGAHPLPLRSGGSARQIPN